MSRPAVDVVVPFAGSDDALRELLARVERLELRDDDTLTVVDNRPGGGQTPVTQRGQTPPAAPQVLHAADRRSSYYARNRGAERGRAPWLLFIDADVDPPADLLERYFDDGPAESTGVVSGAVADTPLGDASTMAERYAVQLEQMSQGNTLRDRHWSYAQTANALFRRKAFEDVGGFEEGIRSGGDADICFRLRAAGWDIESRPGALVHHDNRATLRAFLRQKARHGSGAAWLDKRYPGSFPSRDSRWDDLKWLRRELLAAAKARRAGDPVAAERHLMPPLVIWAFELGRHLPNGVKQRRG